jgi:predicted DNA-binding transcriptional regulator YafY
MVKPRSHRNALIVRLLALVADLSRRDGCDLYELAARHRVTVRTIRRDLDALAEAGVPLLDEEDGRRKRWRIEGADARAEVAALVDTSQVLAIHAALRGVAGASPGTHAVLGDLADKVARALGPADRQRFAALAACFDDRDRATFDAVGSDVLLPVIGAIVDRRCCSVAYRPAAGSASTYVVLPLKLFARDGVAYVLVHHRRRDAVITLALHRIQRLAVTRERAEPPRGFDAQRYLGALFGVHGGESEVTYRLQFSPAVAALIRERRWHPAQTLRARRDGSVVLELTCRESYQVAAWVASWRHHVTVLAPASLRAELRDLGEELIERYGARGT